MAADGRISPLDIVLIDNFPGHPDPLASSYFTDDFDASWGCNVAQPWRKPGTKMRIYQSGDHGPRGWSTLLYAKLDEMDATNVAVAGHICTLAELTRLETWKLSNEVANIGSYASGMCAVCLGAMTEDYYSWFWCGGVAPADQVAAFRTDSPTSASTLMTTLDGVTQGLALVLADADSADSVGEVALGPASAELAICGFACKDDSAV